MTIDNSHLADCFNQFFQDRPHIHVVTNMVAQNFTANVLLALGCVPSMTIEPEEMFAFGAHCDAALFNFGTLDDQRRAAISCLQDSLRENNKPIVLDPVKCYISPHRLSLAQECVRKGVTVLRGNAEEWKVLETLKLPDNLVCVKTGEVDVITRKGQSILVRNGHVLMGQVTAMGCAGGAVTAALAAAVDDPFLAAVTGCVCMGIAGEMASEKALGPGSYAAAFIDALALLTPEIITQKARIESAML